MTTEQIMELLPFLIPLIVIELVLCIVTVRHILTHDSYRRGNRKIWMVVAIVGFNLIGPILYFLLGKEDA